MLAPYDAGAAPFAYIPNSDGLAVLDTATDTVTTIVPGHFSGSVAVDPQGARVYVIDQAGTVSVVDAATNSVTATWQAGPEPAGLAVSPAGTRLYVANRVRPYVPPTAGTPGQTPTPTPTFGIPPTPGQVSVIDTTSGSVLATVATELSPNAVAVSADGAHAFVTNRRYIPEGPPCSLSPPAWCDGIVSVVDTVSNRVTATFSVGLRPAAVAADPQAVRAYVAHQIPDQQLGFRAALSIVDMDSFRVATIALAGSEPQGIAVNPLTSRVYVTGTFQNSVSVVDTSASAEVDVVAVGEFPNGLAVTPDGKRVYVVNGGDGTVSVIDTASDAVVDTVPVGQQPLALGQFIASGMPSVTPPTATITHTPTWTPTMAATRTPTSTEVARKGGGCSINSKGRTDFIGPLVLLVAALGILLRGPVALRNRKSAIPGGQRANERAEPTGLSAVAPRERRCAGGSRATRSAVWGLKTSEQSVIAKRLILILLGLAISSRSGAEESRAELLRSLGEELSRIRASSSDKPVGLEKIPDVASLVGATRNEIRSALGKPDSCFDEGVGCAQQDSWSYGFVKLPTGWLGGGAVLDLKFGADGKCHSASWHFER